MNDKTIEYLLEQLRAKDRQIFELRMQLVRYQAMSPEFLEFPCEETIQ